MNRLIPEVNSSRKVDHKSFIDRSQSVECMTESKYFDVLFKVSQSAIQYKGTWPGILFVDKY